MIEDHLREATDEEKLDVRVKMGADWQRIEQTMLAAEPVSRSREAGHRRYFRLVEIADEFSKLVAPYAACQGKGCSHCCRQAVNITEREAIRIGDYLGRRPVRVPVESDPHVLLQKLEADVERYTAQACPMLASDGSCSVYPVRPITCRLQHSLEADPGPCDLVAGRAWVKKLNTQSVSIVAVAMDLSRSIGDIREFFP